MDIRNFDGLGFFENGNDSIKWYVTDHMPSSHFAYINEIAYDPSRFLGQQGKVGLFHRPSRSIWINTPSAFKDDYDQLIGELRELMVDNRQLDGTPLQSCFRASKSCVRKNLHKLLSSMKHSDADRTYGGKIATTLEDIKEVERTTKSSILLTVCHEIGHNVYDNVLDKPSRDICKKQYKCQKAPAPGETEVESADEVFAEIYARFSNCHLRYKIEMTEKAFYQPDFISLLKLLFHC